MSDAWVRESVESRGTEPELVTGAEHRLEADPEPATEPERKEEAGTSGRAENLGPPQTGNARVDAATALLVDLADRPTSEHGPLFEEVHQRLHAALADLDDE